jgi:hypothetical protein
MLNGPMHTFGMRHQQSNAAIGGTGTGNTLR